MREWHNGGHSTQDLHFTGFWIVKGTVEWELGTKHIWGSIGRAKRKVEIEGKREGDIYIYTHTCIWYTAQHAGP